MPHDARPRAPTAVTHAELLAILEAWSEQSGVAFEWEPEGQTWHGRPKGTWLARLGPPEDEDWIRVHPLSPAEVELAMVASAGHVDVWRMGLEDLQRELAGAEEYFRGWTRFMASGPGRGH